MASSINIDWSKKDIANTEKICFDGFENLFENLLKNNKIIVSNNKDCYIVYELNINNIYDLIKECKDYIKIGIDYNSIDEYNNSFLAKLFGKDNENISGDLCYILMNLKYIKDILKCNQDGVCIIEIK